MVSHLMNLVTKPCRFVVRSVDAPLRDTYPDLPWPFWTVASWNAFVTDLRRLEGDSVVWEIFLAALLLRLSAYWFC